MILSREIKTWKASGCVCGLRLATDASFGYTVKGRDGTLIAHSTGDRGDVGGGAFDNKASAIDVASAMALEFADRPYVSEEDNW